MKKKKNKRKKKKKDVHKKLRNSTMGTNVKIETFSKFNRFWNDSRQIEDPFHQSLRNFRIMLHIFHGHRLPKNYGSVIDMGAIRTARQKLKKLTDSKASVGYTVSTTNPTLSLLRTPATSPTVKIGNVLRSVAGNVGGASKIVATGIAGASSSAATKMKRHPKRTLSGTLISIIMPYLYYSSVMPSFWPDVYNEHYSGGNQSQTNDTNNTRSGENPVQSEEENEEENEEEEVAEEEEAGNDEVITEEEVKELLQKKQAKKLLKMIDNIPGDKTFESVEGVREYLNLTTEELTEFNSEVGDELITEQRLDQYRAWLNADQDDSESAEGRLKDLRTLLNQGSDSESNFTISADNIDKIDVDSVNKLNEFFDTNGWPKGKTNTPASVALFGAPDESTGDVVSNFSVSGIDGGEQFIQPTTVQPLNPGNASVNASNLLAGPAGDQGDQGVPVQAMLG